MLIEITNTVELLKPIFIYPTIYEIYKYLPSKIDPVSFEKLILDNSKNLSFRVIKKNYICMPNEFVNSVKLIENRHQIEKTKKLIIRILSKKLNNLSDVYALFVFFDFDSLVINIVCNAKQIERTKLYLRAKLHKIPMKYKILYINKFEDMGLDLSNYANLLESSIILNKFKTYEKIVGYYAMSLHEAFPNYPINNFYGIRYDKKIISDNIKISFLNNIIDRILNYKNKIL